MNELLIFGDLHKYLNSLGPMNLTLAPKSLTLGYKPKSFLGSSNKFATLYWDKRYYCLILHVDPGNPESEKGRKVQKEIQELLKFNIKEIRNFLLKKHEVYIPFEIINSKEKIEILKGFIKEQYNIFQKNLKRT